MSDRRAELLGAAATGDLTAAERHELQVLAAEDPGVRLELEELLAMVTALPARGSGYDETPPSEALTARVRALASAAPAHPVAAHPVAAPLLPGMPGPDTQGPDTPGPDSLARDAGRRRPLQVIAAFGLAAALLVIGGVAGAGLQAGLSGEPAAAAPEPSPSPSTPSTPSSPPVNATPSATPTGPPGTLGVAETITFRDKPSDVTVTATVTAHTWGTETALSIAGLPAGDRYEVVVVERDGDDQQSGAFIGTAQTVVCRMNAAVLRPQVRAIEVRDENGETIMSSSLPTVRT